MNSHSDSSVQPREARQSEERDQRRRRILEAAEAAFAGHGFYEASMTEIARQAGFATGTLYLYFRDKSDLYGRLVLEKMAELASQVEMALATAIDPPTGLLAMARVQFAFHDANRRFFEIFLQQTQLASSPVHAEHWEEMEATKLRIRRALEKCVRQGQKMGILKAGNPSLFAVAFLGITLQIIRQSIREAAPGELAPLADFAADCFLNGTRL